MKTKEASLDYRDNENHPLTGVMRTDGQDGEKREGKRWSDEGNKRSKGMWENLLEPAWSSY